MYKNVVAKREGFPAWCRAGGGSGALAVSQVCLEIACQHFPLINNLDKPDSARIVLKNEGF